jgi:hypothetical protein
MKTVFIYGLRDPQTNELRYVGKTINPKLRLAKHLTRKENTYKWSWLKSLGSRCPELVILQTIENSNDADWQVWEEWWIKYLTSIGYRLTNLNGGGQGGICPSEETRLKMSRSATGKVMSDAAKAKLRDKLTGIPKPVGFSEKLRKANLGKTHSQETRKCLSILGKQRFCREHHRKMCAASKTPEAIHRMRSGLQKAAKRPEVVAAKLLGNKKKMKAVRQLTLTGEWVADYESTVAAAAQVGVNPSHVSSCAVKRKGFVTAGGFRWEFADKTNS